jgi:predicted RNA-binding protein YlqC (UPF0109 family)
MNQKELLEYIVKAMVDNPEQIEISEIEGSQDTRLELKVAKADMGKVIGKKGNNVHAIRTILLAASAKAGKRITLEIIE